MFSRNDLHREMVFFLFMLNVELAAPYPLFL